MRHFMFIFLLAIFLAIGGGFGNSTAAADDWTILVYLDGDNNLEDDGIDDFLEMATVGSDSNINIVVQFDRIDGYSAAYEDWTTCKRFLVTSGMTPVAANQISDLGEVNMGDPATLTGFINWGTSTYPATRYALILWNHGGGWRENLKRASLIETIRSLNQGKNKETFDAAKSSLIKKDLTKELKKTDPFFLKGVCWDDTNSGDYLEMREVRQLLNNATTDMDLIGFDACLMSMIEVAHEIKDTGADVMVGSEETEPGNGWPYNTILSDLAGNPTATPSQLGTYIVDRYYASYVNPQTQTAIDLTTMNALSEAVSTFAESLRNNWNSNKNAVKAEAQNVMTAIDTTVIHDKHGSSFPGAHGLAVYFPTGSMNSNYNGSIINFAADTYWDEFLGDYQSSLSGSWIETCRGNSQEFYDPAHIDLYDFCQEINVHKECNTTYTVKEVTYAFDDISSTGTSVSLTDDSTAQISIGFGFQFYCDAYTSFWIQSNGGLTFESTVLDWDNSRIPTNGVSALIAPFWDDLNPFAGGTVCYQLKGSAPNRRLIAQWEDVPHLSSSDGGTFQVILYEGSDEILFQYQDVDFADASYDNGASASVGIQLNLTTGIDYSYNSASLTNSFAIMFTPKINGCGATPPINSILLGD